MYRSFLPSKRHHELHELDPKRMFYEQFGREMLEGERIRTRILTFLFLVVTAAAGVNFILNWHALRHSFHSVTAVYAAGALFILMIVYELMLGFVLSRRIRCSGKPFPLVLRYWNAFVETSMPTILLYLFGQSSDPIFALIAPGFLLYFIFIILSTLRLDFGLSLFTGLVASVEYFLFVAYVLAGKPVSHFPPIMSSIALYLPKSAILLCCAVIAGFVAIRLKQHIYDTIKVVDQRNRIVNLFGQQVSKSIVDYLVEQDSEESRRQQVCVMFLDIRGFTKFADGKTPEQIVAYQNAVFSFMIEIVNRHHGIINQLLGDGFMASFGVPLSGGNDVRNAFEAAREILRRLDDENLRGAIPPTRVGIGLHYGEAVTGNVGTVERKQYSITGNVVILSSRIEQLNKEYDSQFLVSEEVWKELGDEKPEASCLGPIAVRGREEPITIFKIA